MADTRRECGELIPFLGRSVYFQTEKEKEKEKKLISHHCRTNKSRLQ